MRIIACTTFSCLDRGAISLHEVIAGVLATDGNLTTKPLPSPSQLIGASRETVTRLFTLS